MNRANKIVLAALLGLFFACCFFTAQRESAKAAAESAGECIVEVSSRRFLMEKNADLPLPMASTTKILTAIILIEDCDLNEIVRIPKAAEGVEGSSVYLRAGEEYTVEELLYGLMLRSGNDCAVALALHHSGSIEEFAQRMNERAAILGARDSFFCNPHGLPANGHHTTARDLALISAYAMANQTFEKIVSAKYYVRHNWKNKNKMLNNFEGAIGIKTGFTRSAGRCLVVCAERKGMRLVSVVFNSPQMYERTEEILEEAFTKYTLVKLCDSSRTVNGLRFACDFEYPLAQEERDMVSVSYETFSPVPQQRGEFAGLMKVYLKKNLIFSQNLYII